MPFKTVLVKGLGKVKFPGDMADDAIEDVISKSINVYSGTGMEPIKSLDQIVPFGKSRPGYPDNYFGGIFGSQDKSVAESYGQLQKFLVPEAKHASHDDIVHDLIYEDDGLDILRQAVSETRYKDLTDDELDELSEFVSERRSPFEDEPDMGEERLFEILGAEDAGEASWKLQGLKGEFARRKGYESVGMPDEHGESVLVLGGPNTRMALSGAGAATGLGLMSDKVKAEPRTASVTGKIEGPAPGRENIAKVSEFIDRHDDIVFDDLLGGVTSWLNKLSYDDKLTFKDRLMAALDLM